MKFIRTWNQKFEGAKEHAKVKPAILALFEPDGLIGSSRLSRYDEARNELCVTDTAGKDIFEIVNLGNGNFDMIITDRILKHLDLEKPVSVRDRINGRKREVKNDYQIFLVLMNLFLSEKNEDYVFNFTNLDQIEYIEIC